MESSIDVKPLADTIRSLSSDIGLPPSAWSIGIERDVFFFRVQLKSISEVSFLDTIAIAKRHIENWRIHTFERGFLSIQALNKNLIDTEGLFKNIKIRLSGLYGEKGLEISKKGELSSSEQSLLIALIKHLYKAESQMSPQDKLRESGCLVIEPPENNNYFSEIYGYSAVKEEIKETILLPLKNPDFFDKVAIAARGVASNARPKAILFNGPPGTGKTTMAKTVAKEAGITLVYVPLENIMSAYYGESSKKLGLIFDGAFSLEKGAILFLDEIDALAPSRNEKLFEATRRMLSVLLQKIEGLGTKDGILTIGATNRSQDIDAALLSRFDTIIEFGLPSKTDIEEMLMVIASHLVKEERTQLADSLKGFSPRNIRDICERAERKTARMLLMEKKEPRAPEFSTYMEIADATKNV